MATATLNDIRIKVRRLTRSNNTSQMSDSDLDNYIDTFIMYNFPSNLRTFTLRKTFTFYTQPNVDTYQTDNTLPTTAPLYNFKNQIIAIHQPIYLAGVQGFYTQWRDVFYGYYPQTNTIADTNLRGNGTLGPFAGTVVAIPMLQNNVIFTCLDTTGNAMILVDTPTSNSSGNLIIPNDPTVVYGTINYVTGVFSFSFPNATQNAAIVYVENIAYAAGKPLAILYFNNVFTIRPVPDNVYAIQLEADVRPTALMSVPTAVPDLEQWWQYIAYGASKLIFEDRMDTNSLQQIMPEFKQQEQMVLRTSLTQAANERTVTIYTQGKNFGFGWFGAGGWPY